jgi:hypothetical protein
MRRLVLATRTGTPVASRLRDVVASGTHDSLREGPALGILVATGIWVWLAAVDAIAGHPFHTLSVLANLGLGARAWVGIFGGSLIGTGLALFFLSRRHLLAAQVREADSQHDPAPRTSPSVADRRRGRARS